MLVIPVLRLFMLVLLLVVLIDGATQQGLYNRWNFLLWAQRPDLPAGFFDLLRIVLSICLAWDAWTHTRYARLGFVGSTGWTIVFVLLLVLYQPIFPVQLEYHWWLWIDLVALGVLAFHTWVISRPLLGLLSGAVWRGENLLAVPSHELTTSIYIGYVNAASLMAEPAEFLPEDKKEPTKGPEQKRPPQAKPAHALHSSEGGRPIPPLRRPSDPPGPIVDRRTLSEQIAEISVKVRIAERALESDTMGSERRAALERSRSGLKIILDRKLDYAAGLAKQRDKDL